jgi:hypothetical protein
MTLNGASLSSDIAQRTVLIKLAKPIYDAAWEEDTVAYPQRNRQAIIGDIVAFLRQPADALPSHSRWGAWERDIVARLSEPVDAQALICSRQGAADVENEEGEAVELFMREELFKAGYNPRTDRIVIPVHVANAWFNRGAGERLSVTATSRRLGQMADEGRLAFVRRNPSRTHGRAFLWQGDDASPDTPVLADLNERLARRESNSNWA